MVRGTLFKMKDLYYVLMYNHLGNAKECKTLIRQGKIKVNGQIATNPRQSITSADILTYNQLILNSQPFIYCMLNKPQGYICANHDKQYPCVIDLVEHKECFCVGRLDKDTTGLLLLSNDKSLKKLLLPQNHIPKTYWVETLKPLKPINIQQFKQGVVIDKNVFCLSAKLEIIDSYHCQVTIIEGKYHQLKKMFLSIGNQVINLKRIRFGHLVLDSNLNEGQYRSLLPSEIVDLLALLA